MNGGPGSVPSNRYGWLQHCHMTRMQRAAQKGMRVLIIDVFETSHLTQPPVIPSGAA